MRPLSALLRALAPLPLILGFVYSAPTALAQPVNYLIKGSGDTVYYYSPQGKRYFFPSESVFKTWYPDFTNVAEISDTELAKIPLAGNVTYRPGSTLVKITTDPKVYALSLYGTLHWVKTEELAAAIYGLDWNTNVVDVPDTYFTNYIMGFDLNGPNQYSRNEEFANAMTPADNIRPTNYLPEFTAPVTPGAIVNNPSVDVSVSASQVVLNQTVKIDVDVTNSVFPITQIIIRAEGVSAPYATCTNSMTCSAQLTIETAPSNLKFYAEATDAKGGVYPTLLVDRPIVSAVSSSNQIQLSVSPSMTTAGSRSNFTSIVQQNAGIIVAAHKVYALIPGQTAPVLWKDCGTESTCAASSPFYRNTYLYSQITTGGQTLASAPVLVSIQGGEAPKPTLTVTSKVGNVAYLAVTAPYGETIGNTFIVEGTNLEKDPVIAMCDKATCEITLQVIKAASYTAFTWVGGKAEASGTIALTP